MEAVLASLKTCPSSFLVASPSVITIRYSYPQITVSHMMVNSSIFRTGDGRRVYHNQVRTHFGNFWFSSSIEGGCGEREEGV